MVTIILAAGYGTRLYPLTLNKPKALLDVGNKTILDRLLSNIENIKECEKVIIVTNEKFHENFEKWASSSSYRFKIEVINDGTSSDETKLGAIGDINLVLNKSGQRSDLLITGSDNLFEFELKEFVLFGSEKRPYPSIALFDIKDFELAKKYGICALNNEKQVIDFEEKPKSPKSTLAATALYFIPKEKVGHILQYMKTDLPKDAPGNLMKWFTKNDKLFGFTLPGIWYDIGDKKSLEKADDEFRRKGV